MHKPSIIKALVVYNLRGGFLGSVTPPPEQKIFAHKVHLYTNSFGTIPRCFHPKRICSRGGATNSKTRALLEH